MFENEGSMASSPLSEDAINETAIKKVQSPS